MKHNICTWKYNIYKNDKKLTNLSVPCEFKIDFFGMSKNAMTFSYHVHNKISTPI